MTRLDKLVKERKKDGDKASKATTATELPFEETEPWPDPVDAAALLDEIETTIGRFIVCEPPVRTAAALWIAFTWFIDVVQVAPIAMITAPDKGCGKSQLLDLFEPLVRRPMPTSGISAAALFRSIEMWRPTLLVDEGDTFIRDNEDLRGAFNSGHKPHGRFMRVVGDNHIPTPFSTWGAKAIAGIKADTIAATITDRSIVLRMRKKLKTEKVESLRSQAARKLFPVLQQKLARFAADAADEVAQVQEGIDIPDALSDRQKDNWEPLLAIAQVAGGDWPEKTKATALALSGADNEPSGVGAELLANIRTIFQRQIGDPLAHPKNISSADLHKALCEEEDWRWATYNRGREITHPQVKSLLKGYDIHEKPVNLGGKERQKGYRKPDFEDAFARYLPESEAAEDSDADADAEKVTSGVTQKLPKSNHDNLLNLQGSNQVTVFFGERGVKNENEGEEEECRTY